MPYPAGFEYSSYRSKSYGGPKTEELIKAPKNTNWKAKKTVIAGQKNTYYAFSNNRSFCKNGLFTIFVF